MGGLVAIVLVCAASVPMRACTRETALEVREQPGPATPMACLKSGLTDLALDHERLPDVYPLIRCERRKG
ncbi:hypothetical protein MFUR16E_04815 [Methylobacterium fujisawaense]|uniref:hypothetical protein n=1 Tax=Methylobacterium fujisawaense TaxID=107400 RepID=UPI002F2DC46C